MKTIKWLVLQAPKHMRTLVGSLLMAILALSTVVTYLYVQDKNDDKECNKAIAALNKEFKKTTDSLTSVIIQVKEDSKREAIHRLEQIISEQKRVIRSQKTQKTKLEKTKILNNQIIKSNESQINFLKNAKK